VHRYSRIRSASLAALVAVTSASAAANHAATPQQTAAGPQTAARPQTAAKPQQITARPRTFKAFVVDDRLSALRRQPDLKATVVHRLHVGHKVWIIGERAATEEQPRFYRIAVSRRTVGWIHAGAVVVPGRAGDDERLMALIKGSGDVFDRIALCKLFVTSFQRSPLVPRILLTQGEEAERAARMLTQRSTKRLAKTEAVRSSASERDYYLSDAGLDRFSREGVSFDFNIAGGQYVYDGKAYRELVARYSKSDEAEVARRHLQAIDQPHGKEH